MAYETKGRELRWLVAVGVPGLLLRWVMTPCGVTVDLTRRRCELPNQGRFAIPQGTPEEVDADNTWLDTLTIIHHSVHCFGTVCWAYLLL